MNDGEKAHTSTTQTQHKHDQKTRENTQVPTPTSYPIDRSPVVVCPSEGKEDTHIGREHATDRLKATCPTLKWGMTAQFKSTLANGDRAWRRLPPLPDHACTDARRQGRETRRGTPRHGQTPKVRSDTQPLPKRKRKARGEK